MNQKQKDMFDHGSTLIPQDSKRVLRQALRNMNGQPHVYSLLTVRFKERHPTSDYFTRGE